MNLVPRRGIFDFDDMLGLWAPPRGTLSASGAFSPRVDVKDMKDHYQISAELPGVDKKDIEVSLQDGVLTISAETRQEDVEEKDGKVVRQERRYGKYSRSFDVGAGVQEADIKATFKDGVLTLEAPKAEPKAPEVRRIAIH